MGFFVCFLLFWSQLALATDMIGVSDDELLTVVDSLVESGAARRPPPAPRSLPSDGISSKDRADPPPMGIVPQPKGSSRVPELGVEENGFYTYLKDAERAFVEKVTKRMRVERARKSREIQHQLRKSASSVEIRKLYEQLRRLEQDKINEEENVSRRYREALQNTEGRSEYGKTLYGLEGRIYHERLAQIAEEVREKMSQWQELEFPQNTAVESEVPSGGGPHRNDREIRKGILNQEIGTLLFEAMVLQDYFEFVNARRLRFLPFFSKFFGGDGFSPRKAQIFFEKALGFGGQATYRGAVEHLTTGSCQRYLLEGSSSERPRNGDIKRLP